MIVQLKPAILAVSRSFKIFYEGYFKEMYASKLHWRESGGWGGMYSTDGAGI
jgi:hypothetical protein